MKTKNIFTWILQIAVAAIIARFGVDKLMASPASVDLFASLGMEPSGRYLIGILELTAALLLLFPYSIAWGAMLAWGLMTGALIGHLTRLGMEGQMLTMTLMAAFNWLATIAILYIRRDQVEFIRSMFARESEPEDSGNTRNP